MEFGTRSEKFLWTLYGSGGAQTPRRLLTDVSKGRQWRIKDGSQGSQACIRFFFLKKKPCIF